MEQVEYLDIIEENFPEIKADLNLQIERKHQNLGKKEISTPGHNLVKFLIF